MSAREVEITCSSRGLREILVDGEELDCSAIRDKLIPDWFKPARDDRSGWRGLIKEIQTTLADDEAELHFTFYGRREQEHQFFNCLDEYGMNGGEKATAEEVSEARIHDAQKAALRGQSTIMLKNLMVAAELGNAEAMRSIAVCYRDGLGVDADYETASEWLRKAAKAGDKQAQEMLLQPMGMPVNNESSSAYAQTKAILGNAVSYIGIGADTDSKPENQEYENLKKLMDDERYEDAFPLAQKFADRNDAYAQMSLGLCYLMRDTEEDAKCGIEWTQKAVEQGYAEAQYQLGECYYYGAGVAKDEYAAFGWYQKAAEQNDADAQAKLGDCYCFGEGTVEDKNEAFQWYQKAMERDNAEAQNMLGRCFLEGWGTVKDDIQAFKWYEKAAEQGLAVAQNNLAYCYRNGLGVEANEVKAFEWLSKAAEQGDADAQNALGDCYCFGIGVAEDKSAAFQWYQKAAEQDNAEAQNMLGQCFLEVKDDIQAFKWYEKAAEQGLAVAQNNLAYCYRNGLGVEANEVKAFEWYTEAAEQGDADAQNALGDCYCFGIGVAEDKSAAFQWYQKAAEQGNAEAWNMLGRCYDEGWGVTQAAVEATMWYEKAAKQGLALAQYNLAYCYDNGIGVQENIAKAFELYGEAAEQGAAIAQCALGIDYALGCGTKKDLNKAEHWLKLAVEQEDMAAHYWLAEVMYAQNVRDGLSYSQFYQDLKKRFGNVGTDIATNAIAGAIGVGFAFLSYPLAIAGGVGYWGYTAFKSVNEKNTAKAFLNTKAGREMLSLYQYAADNGMEPAQKKLAQLRKYL